jgi:hypothetical protein
LTERERANATPEKLAPVERFQNSVGRVGPRHRPSFLDRVRQCDGNSVACRNFPLSYRRRFAVIFLSCLHADGRCWPSPL